MTDADRATEVQESSARALRYRANIQAELDRAAVYGAMAEVEPDHRLAESYRRLAASEADHAEFWRRQLAEVGADAPSRASFRARVLARLARRFGSRLVLPAAASLEAAEQVVFRDQPETLGTDLAASEHDHARVFDEATETSTPGRMARTLDHLFGRRHGVTGNALRAAVLGANDGLVSNLSLVMGAAGASFSSSSVLITGIAGLLAGAFSMAMGEWVSVQSSREMNQRMLEREAVEIATDPEHEHAELVTLYRRRGLTSTEAGTVADRIMNDPEAALDTMARDELGIDPEELGGSPWTAAIASFLLFTVGAVVPILPFVFADGDLAVALSVLVSGVALLAIGAAITLLTGRAAWRSALRQLAIGLGAAAVTYGAGYAVGSVV
ncbi:MAG TPA: VIT1/CCC1 transporter family protein [Solirubrobacterales bacterium]|nr:VIT1/CCC1 transporter family protein [Solirubrobacterales bacterium]